MGTQDDFFIADGPVSDFIAIGSGIGYRTFFVYPEPLFDYGSQFQGWFYGALGAAGATGPNNEFGPDTNSYSDFAGVWGQAVYVTGVAGTSSTRVGVYGQTEEDPDSSIPQNISAGVFGAANTGSGVVGWSTTWNGVEGWAPQGTGVLGVSEFDRGVHGASTWQPGVQGWSVNDVGVMGGSGPEGTQGPTVPNTSNTAGVVGTSDQQHGVIGTTNTSVGVIGFSTNGYGVIGATSTGPFAGYFFGNLGVTGSKAAVVPFPDGTRRALYCMESPELWFEDFGHAKLARGRGAVKLDSDFAKVIKSGGYHVFLTPEGDCRGLYVRRKNASGFEVRELQGGESNVAFSYRIVGRRKDISAQKRFAKIEGLAPLPGAGMRRASRKPAPTAAGLRAFTARLEKKARERAPKGAEKARARMGTKRSRPDLMSPLPKGAKRK